MVELDAPRELYTRDARGCCERHVSVLAPIVCAISKCAISVSVRHRPHQLWASFSHQEPALLDEAYSIVVEITNTDDRALDVVVDVLLQPTEVDEAGASPRVDTSISHSILAQCNPSRLTDRSRRG